MDSAEQVAVLACVATHAINIKYSNLKGGGDVPEFAGARGRPHFVVSKRNCCPDSYYRAQDGRKQPSGKDTSRDVHTPSGPSQHL